MTTRADDDAPEPGSLDLSDPELVVRHGGPPHAYLRRLRAEAPVCWHEPPRDPKGVLAVRQGYWVVAKHADVVEVSRHPRRFSSALGSHLIGEMAEEDLAGMRTQLIGMDPPQHVKYRRLVQRGFTPRMVAKLEPRIREVARQAVARVAPRGECEFVEELASELPLVLICELMGVPQEDRKKIFEWSNQLVGADDPEQQSGTDPKQVAMAMWLYSNELAERKRAAPDDTLMSLYVHSAVDGETISAVEINHFFVLLAVAGNETTRNATSHFVRLMSAYPEQHARLRADVDGLLPSAIEEALRFSPPVMYFRRTATEDTELRGTRIHAGDKLYLSYPSANRDEDLFPQPDRFDIGREPNDHLAFGIGEHYCLGANLARMQLRCILREVLTRLPDLRLSEPAAIQRGTLIHGVKRMPVRFRKFGTEG
jgi:cholest-4-en-3-one 26-monooxygenase